jgi:aspartyl-tRNA(Asn)/glutamyl-tRNA(Gln) amidotransferase subunit B
MALLEIVTEPRLEVGEDAEISSRSSGARCATSASATATLRRSSARRERIDQPRGAGPPQVEIKNLNSTRFVRLGFDYVIERHPASWTKGGTACRRALERERDQTSR